MRETITVAEYSAAFTTWAMLHVSRNLVVPPTFSTPEIVERGMYHLRQHVTERGSTVIITTLCKVLGDWMTEQQRNAVNNAQRSVLMTVRMDASKSNLLARMIYNGEPLRSVKCPTHEGRWDGQAMLNGCKHGCHGTGWLL